MKINERKLKNGQIKLTGYGASAEVGRSAFVIEDDKRRVLIECGLKIMPGDEPTDRKSTRLNSSHSQQSRMPSSA